KLHGSIENKNSLLIFIERIATKDNQVTIFNFLKSLFKTDKKEILFCGYSFSDEFDINPALSLTDKASKKFYIIEHRTSFLTEEIKELNNSKLLCSCLRLTCNFDKLINDLSDEFFVKPFKTP